MSASHGGDVHPRARAEGSRALVVGEALVDVVRRPDGTVDEHPGGSPANVALGLARLGRPVELVTWIGTDARGHAVRDHLESAGVRLSPGSDGAATTSVATATLDGTGAATYTFDLDWQVPAGRAPDDGGVVVVHTSTIGAVLEPGAPDVLRLLAEARVDATITYDPNIRPDLLGDADDARETVERLVLLADVVKVSDEDLVWLEPGTDPGDVVRRWASRGPGLVVLTRGGAGALAVTAGGVEVSVTAPSVEVADTVGAGDSFMSGLLDGLWSAGLLGASHRIALGGVGAEVLTPVLERCARIAAITVSRPGANPPRADEVDDVDEVDEGTPGAG
ncbi:carbohydrate kinase [Cellulomonas sp. ATA003]|uniref:carbohydrate kinase family protein n=1 Tax=Cellulomonas sp. ATA003 TaxID=3073064 RepID=UPI0028733B03|nr:carbohydrate kinase [Cellulomonas sp. ATA003]WNB85031.1 carbohydrate kinase [Cellulomonas sp. ATA003]